MKHLIRAFGKETMTLNGGRISLFLAVLAWCVRMTPHAMGDEAASKNCYVPYPTVVTPTEGISWPKGQALPTFAAPASTLDCIIAPDLTEDEQITFCALAGIVNRKQPRIFLPQDGNMIWADTATFGFKKRKFYSKEDRYDLVDKYAKEVDGVVIYNPNVSPHYRNLAGTVAAQSKALPVTADVYKKLKDRHVNLPVIADLTDLKMTSSLEIYQHLYDRYWAKSEKRLLIHAKPLNLKGGGDYHHTRDMAAATGAAIIWLDTQIPAEKALMRKFAGDMKAGEAIVLGWFFSERSGITTLSEFGIGTMAADSYSCSTVYSGNEPKIQIPVVPKMPELESKVYVALFISDGDNIQYTQHAMRTIWDKTASLRGKVALNWTIAPGLVDIGPSILNYYYTTATPKDCFVSGPSGMGYMMANNTLEEPSVPIGEYLKDPAKMDGFAKLTETYLQRSGLRVVTIWDDLTSKQRKSYEANCRHLYGATVQNFKDVPSVAGSIENKRVLFDKLVIPYAGSYEHMSDSLTEQIKGWSGNKPLFLSYQANIWGDLKPEKLIQLHQDIQKKFPGKVEFVRADHYFNLHNQAAGLPFNLTILPNLAVDSSDSEGNMDLVTDGTPAKMWTASSSGDQWFGLDFGKNYQISRYVIRHAGDGAMGSEFNNADFKVGTSEDGKSWKLIHTIVGNKLNVTDMEFEPVIGRYVKFLFKGCKSDGKVRVADLEVYGASVDRK